MKGLPAPLPLRHLDFLDGLRALAALFVVAHHALLEVDPGYKLGRSHRFLEVFYFGHYAVDVFIVLSGFCLMLPVARGDGFLRGGTLNFFERRAWRILPPYYFAMGCSLLMIWAFIGQKTGTHWDVSLPVTTQGIVRHLVLLQDVFGDNSINHPFWSVSVEWRIYFLFPILLVIWRKVGAQAGAALVIAFSYVLLVLCVRFIGRDCSAHFLGLFCMGMLGASVAFSPSEALHSWRNLPWNRAVFGLGAIVFLASFPKLWRGPIIPFYLQDYLVGVWTLAVLVAACASERRWWKDILGSRPLVFVGTFAYSLYLMHAPLQHFLWQYAFSALQRNPLAMFSALLLSTFPIIGVAYLFFLAFERPFLSKGKKKTPVVLAQAAAIEPAP